MTNHPKSRDLELLVSLKIVRIRTLRPGELESIGKWLDHQKELILKNNADLAQSYTAKYWRIK